MRGTSILQLPGLLMRAAIGFEKEVSTKHQKSVWWRVRYQYLMWQMDYDMEHFETDMNKGKYRTVSPKQLSSLEEFKKVLD